MPSADKIQHWMLTIKYSQDQPLPPAFWEWVRPAELFSVQEMGENGDNPHYHIMLDYPAPGMSKQTLHNQLKKILPDQAPSKKGFSEWITYGQTPDELQHYVCKGLSHGVLPVVHHNPYNWPVQQFHDAYWTKNTIIKETKKDPKKIVSPLHEQILAKVKYDETLNYWDHLRLCTDAVMEITGGKINDHIAWPHIQFAMNHLEKRTSQITRVMFYDRIAKKCGDRYNTINLTCTDSAYTDAIKKSLD